MAGDEEGDALRPDVLVGQALAGLLVDAGEHPAEQVGGVARRPLCATFGDELVHQVVHERLVLLQLPLCTDLQSRLDLELAGPGLGLRKGPHHRVDERVRRLAVEGVEPVPESAEGDRVERQPGHVGRHVDRLARVEACPLLDQLVRDVEHLGHVVPHRLQAERRHQDVVRPAPQRVLGLGGEQARPPPRRCAGWTGRR